MLESLFSLPLAYLLVWSLMPLVRHLGVKFGIIDPPNHRKIHQEPTPCSGGIAIYLGFFITLFFTLLITPDLSHKIAPRIVGLSIVSGLLLLLGLYDDKKDAPAHWKFLGQILISLLAICLGFRIDTFTNPFGGHLYLGWLSIPITLFWFLGFINIINLIDGLDGLAGGIVSIASITLLIISLSSGNLACSILVAALTGATLSFLRFNFSHKRKIFLGDNGSMLLGFLLASIAIIGSYKGATFSILLTTILCLGVPVLDTASAIIRRLKRGVGIFSADKDHIHHKLLKDGFTKIEVIVAIYGITLLFSIAGLIFTFTHNKMVPITIIAMGILIVLIKRQWWLNRLKGLSTFYSVYKSLADKNG